MLPSRVRHAILGVMSGRNADRHTATLAVLALAGALLAGCDQKTPDHDVAASSTKTSIAPAQPEPKAVLTLVPALTRGDLVDASRQAASAYVEGKRASEADPLVGRSFAVRIAFGCNGPISSEALKSQRDGLAGWSWGRDKKTIHISMTPGDWAGSALLAGTGAADKWEAVEGVWIPRPWLAAESCPAIQADPLQTDVLSASPQTVGLAAVFEAGSSRIGRRNGRAYEVTISARGDESMKPPEGGYWMVLQGRVTSFPSGRAIECRAPGPDQRPICIVAVQLDRAAYEDAAGGSLSEWRTG